MTTTKITLVSCTGLASFMTDYNGTVVRSAKAFDILVRGMLSEQVAVFAADGETSNAVEKYDVRVEVGTDVQIFSINVYPEDRFGGEILAPALRERGII